MSRGSNFGCQSWQQGHLLTHLAQSWGHYFWKLTAPSSLHSSIRKLYSPYSPKGLGLHGCWGGPEIAEVPLLVMSSVQITPTPGTPWSASGGLDGDPDIWAGNILSSSWGAGRVNS